MNTYTYHLRVILGTDAGGDEIQGCIIRRSWGSKHEAIRFAMKFLAHLDVRLVTIIQEGDMNDCQDIKVPDICTACANIGATKGGLCIWCHPDYPEVTRNTKG